MTVFEFLPALKADKILVDQARTRDNITIITNAATRQITAAGGKVDGLEYEDRGTGDLHRKAVAGVFVQIGLVPNSRFLADIVEMTPFGEIIVDDKCATSAEGIFACGDVTTVPYKQIVISMGEGSKAALSGVRIPVDARGAGCVIQTGCLSQSREPAAHGGRVLPRRVHRRLGCDDQRPAGPYGPGPDRNARRGPGAGALLARGRRQPAPERGWRCAGGPAGGAGDYDGESSRGLNRRKKSLGLPCFLVRCGASASRFRASLTLNRRVNNGTSHCVSLWRRLLRDLFPHLFVLHRLHGQPAGAEKR